MIKRKDLHIKSNYKITEFKELNDFELSYIWLKLIELPKKDIYLSNGLLSEAGINLYYSRDEISFRIRRNLWGLDPDILHLQEDFIRNEKW